MSNDTNRQTERPLHGKIYKVLNMQKKTGNNLICKDCNNLQLFKSHIFVGMNSPAKYNLINITQSKPRFSFQKKKTPQNARLKP
jgi:cytochrome c